MSPDLDALERAARAGEAKLAELDRYRGPVGMAPPHLVELEDCVEALNAAIARVRAAEAALVEAREIIEKAEGATQDAYSWASADAQGQSFSARGYQKSVTDFEAKARAWLAQNPAPATKNEGRV